MTPTILTVRPEHLASLTADQAVYVLADILWAEARRIGLPTTSINISLRVTVPDGGVDASVDADYLKTVTTIIPAPRTAFQVKTGTTFKPSQKSAIKEELFGSKPPSKEALGASVRSCLDGGGTYVLVCFGTDPVATEHAAALEHLVDYFTQCGYPDPHVLVWGQSHLIGILARFVGPSLRVNGASKASFLIHSEWGTRAEMMRPFVAGDEQSRLIDGLRSQLRGNDDAVHVHVRGEAGIGKTRLVLEATAADDLRPLVVYCNGPKHLLEGELLNELLRDGSSLVAIVVVDECDRDSQYRIWDRLKPQGSRIKVVTIYNDVDQPSGTTVTQDVTPLAPEQVSDIIQGYGIPKEDARRWAEFCDGSPRVAHVIGQNLTMNPDDVLRSPDTVNVWDRYLTGGDDPKSDDVRQRKIVLEHIALFRRFGYTGSVAAEGKAIAELIHTSHPEITPARFHEIVKLLRDRKILQGENTLYLTPRLLHIKLWTDWWDARAAGFDIKTFQEHLPATLLDWFYEMFRYARESKAALRVSHALLGEGGPLAGIDFLASRRTSRFFLALTEGAPSASLAYLKRTFRTWTHEQFAAFGETRRDVVWALEKIAVWRELFAGAAELLLRLAEAENENFANNATGVFAGLFSPGYGGLAPTEASLEERFPILKEALESPSRRRRDVALAAARQGLEAFHLTRMIGAEYQGLRHPPKLWTPQTWGEVFDGYRRVWHLLSERVARVDVDERAHIVETVTSQARGLARIGNLTEMLADSLDSIGAIPAIDRRPIISVVEDILHYDADALDASHRERWERLRQALIGKDFHSQLLRYVGMEVLHDRFDADGKVSNTTNPAIRALAEASERDPALLRPELAWLVTAKATRGYEFGRELARLDRDYKFLGDIRMAQIAAHDEPSPFFLGGYASVMFERDRDRWESLLDEMAADATAVQYVPELTWRSGLTDRAANRVLALVRSGNASPSSLRLFAYGGAIRSVSERTLIEWLRVLTDINKREAASAALELLHLYYVMNGAERALPREPTLSILLAPAFFQPDREAKFHLEDYVWTQVASEFIRRYPEDAPQLAYCLLGSFGESGTITAAYHAHPQQVLTAIARLSPAEVWAKVSELLGPPLDDRSFHIRQWLRDGAMNEMPHDDTWRWVEEDVEHRAWLLASFVPPNLSAAQEPPSWARELLIRYGDRDDVRTNLFANFSTGVFHGPISAHYRGKKEWLERLRKDETNPRVGKWLDDYIASVSDQIQNALVREERDEW